MPDEPKDSLERITVNGKEYNRFFGHMRHPDGSINRDYGIGYWVVPVGPAAPVPREIKEGMDE